MIKRVLSKICSWLPMRHQKILAIVYALLYPPADKHKAFYLLNLARDRILPSYYLDWPWLNWMEQDEFRQFLAKFGEENANNGNRRWTMHQLLRLVEGVPGDTCECGVFQGAGSYLICLANEANKKFRKEHHIFDSFAGLSEPGEKDSSGHWEAGALSAGEQVVKENLREFDHFKLYKGWIPARFDEVAEKSFSFVHIDVDLYQPTIDSVKFFYPLLNEGGMLLCDDYMCTTCPGATEAIDSFLADKSEQMISLPAGGGMLIKGVETGPQTIYRAGETGSAISS